MPEDEHRQRVIGCIVAERLARRLLHDLTTKSCYDAELGDAVEDIRVELNSSASEPLIELLTLVGVRLPSARRPPQSCTRKSLQSSARPWRGESRLAS